jgi:hypothetical protein
MRQNRETQGLDEMTVKLPDAEMVMEAQRAATESASKMATAACHYAISINRAWLDLWDSHLNEYLDLPKRLADAQADFLEHAVEHYQESMEKLGGLASKVSQEAEGAMREAQEASECAGQKFQSEAKENGWGARPEDNPKQGAQTNAGESAYGGGDDRREPSHQQSAH